MNEKCTVCLVQSSLAMKHPEADLFRCPSCSHLFSKASAKCETYESDYFESVHHRWFENPNIALFETIEASLSDNIQSLLDVGCGRGDFLKFLRQKRPHLRLVGIDVADLGEVQEFEFLKGDIADFPMNERFDAVVSLAVIEHVPEPRQFVETLKSLLKPYGQLVLMTVKEDSLLYGLARLGKMLCVPLAFNRLYSIHHLNHFTTASLSKLLNLSGIEVDEVVYHDSPLNAVDIPVNNKVLDSVLRSALAFVSIAGKATSTTYLQTFVCRLQDKQHLRSPSLTI